MLEKCLKCNTSFEVDESLITSKLKFFKCSVCDNEWPFVNNKNSEKSPENISAEKLRKDLDAIRSEIEKKTDILSEEIKVQPKEKITKVKNQNYNTTTKDYTVFVDGSTVAFEHGAVSTSSLYPNETGSFAVMIPSDFGPFISYSYRIDWEAYE